MNNLDLARAMIGTPYHNGSSTPGIGCDCIGLIEYVWSEVHGVVPPKRPPMAYDYYDDPADILLGSVRGALIEIDAAEVGCALVFKHPTKPGCSHMGICSAVDGSQPLRMIHAHSGRKVRKVIETSLGKLWLPRLVGKFRL